MCGERTRSSPTPVRLLPKAHWEISLDEVFGIAFDLPTALDERRKAISVRADVESRANAHGIAFLEAIDGSRMHGERDILTRRIIDRGNELEVERDRTAVSDRDADGETDDEVLRDRGGCPVTPRHDGKRDANVSADTRRRGFLRACHRWDNQRDEKQCEKHSEVRPP